ncbi:unnamed protein product [Owenia fusiformis]|uniref:Band 7 domain-containing protein n=1 Tax=Owenia fusiformis TaxID=6347 RepID=A0A8J1Y470_OWEFU|nr:unnamed protein product [Owenia fusiformis]
MSEGKGLKIFIGVIVIGIIAAIVALVASSLKRLDTYEVGLKYDTIARSLEDSATNEGLHLGPPGFEFIIFPSVYKTISFSNLICLNKDGVEITLDVAYQYQAQANHLKSIITQFKDHDTYLIVLYSVGTASLHETCSLFNTSQLQSERGLFQETVRVTLQERYAELHADVTDLQVNNIARPSTYEEAVRSKEAARENIEVARNERPRLETQATTQKREAETQADITVALAESQARIIINRANVEADAIIDQYTKESETYKNLVGSSGLSLTADGFLSYIGVRAISSAKNPVYIGLRSPAKTSYVTP